MTLGPVYSSPSSKINSGAAFFEFAPASGAGIGSACACAAVTGSKSETVTHTRASSAMCLKTGLASTGIINGDAVSCGNNLPRVENDGTANGLLMEESRTNSLLRSSELENVAWSIASGGGASNPTITANYGTAPDGTATADRVEIPGCATGGSYSLVLQNYTGSAATWSTSMFIKGTSGSGTIILISLDATLVSGLFVACTYNASTWTWCGGPAAPLVKTFANASSRVYLGCDNNSGAVVGTTDTGAADVLVWNVQAELGAFPSNPIPTTTAAVVRSSDSAIVTIPTGLPSGGGSMAVSVITEGTTRSNGGFVGFHNAAAGTANTLIHTGIGVIDLYVGTVPTLMTGTISQTSNTMRASAFWGASTSLTVTPPGTTVTGGLMNSGAVLDRAVVGSYVGGNLQAGLYSRICLDSSPSRCL